MEPRAAIGSYDKATGASRSPCWQGVFGMKADMPKCSKSTPKKVRVITGNVGGSFGMKAPVFPEYICVLHAARAPAGR